MLLNLTHPRKRVLFNGITPIQFMVFKPIYNRLMQYGIFDIYFMNSINDYNFYEQFGIPSEQFVEKRNAFLMNWDLYISADVFEPRLMSNMVFRFLPIKFPLLRKPKMVLISHGISEKKYLFEDDKERLRDIIKSYDRIFFSSKKQLDRLNELFDDEFRANFEYVGFPRLEELTNGQYNDSSLKERLNIDNDLPVILFAPTWGNQGCLETFGTKIVERLLSLEANVLLKMHDNSNFGLHSSQAQNYNQFGKFADKENFQIVHDNDIYPYLHLADVLIADYGSLILEYLTLNKPAVFLDLKKHNDEVVSNLNKLMLLREACVTISSPEQVIWAVGQAKDSFCCENTSRQELISEYVDEAPHATDRIIKSICLLVFSE